MQQNLHNSHHSKNVVSTLYITKTVQRLLGECNKKLCPLPSIKWIIFFFYFKISSLSLNVPFIQFLIPLQLFKYRYHIFCCFLTYLINYFIIFSSILHFHANGTIKIKKKNKNKKKNILSECTIISLPLKSFFLFHILTC